MNRKLINWTMHGTHGEDEMTDENILNILSYSYFLVCPFLALVLPPTITELNRAGYLPQE